MHNLKPESTIRHNQNCAPGSGTFEECGICACAEEQHKHKLTDEFMARLIEEEQGCIYFMGSPEWEKAYRPEWGRY